MAYKPIPTNSVSKSSDVFQRSSMEMRTDREDLAPGGGGAGIKKR